MVAAIADTHTAIWYLFNDARLSQAAGDFIDNTAAAGRHIGVATISLAEVVYPTEKNRPPLNAYENLSAALADPDYVLTAVPLTADIVAAMPQVQRDAVPD